MGHRLRVVDGLWRASVTHDVVVPFFIAPHIRKDGDEENKWSYAVKPCTNFLEKTINNFWRVVK
jgi:hypothetical protein